MAICDAHFHILPGFRGYTGKGEVLGIGGGLVQYSTGEQAQAVPPSFQDTNFTLSAGLEYLEEAGVETAVLMQATYYGIHNDYVGAALAAKPHMFRGCICIDPYSKYWREILARSVEQGLSAVKFEMSEDYGLTGIHPYLRVTDPYLAPFWNQLVTYGLPFVIDPGWGGTLGNRPDDIRELLAKFPDLHVIVCHLGQPLAEIVEQNVKIVAAEGRLTTDDVARDESWWEWMQVAANSPHVDAFDLSILHTFAEYEQYPFPTAQEYVRIAAELVGAQRLMWASDIPSVLLHATYQQSIDWVRRHCEFLTPQERELVMAGNAHRVFGFDSAGRAV
jgi:predicted TIM-barrel fold metal-dependent hydrolase